MVERFVRARGGAVELILEDLVDFCGEDEVTFGESVDFVGPDFDSDLSPGEMHVGMVGLFLGYGAGAIDEGECLGEIGKVECFGEVVLSLGGPAGQLLEEGVDLVFGEGRDTSAAGHAGFCS